MKNKQLEYLFVLFGMASFAGYLWGLCYVVQSFETFLFSILLGFITGFIASLYFSKGHGLFFPLSAFLATLWGFITAKYIIYAYLNLGFYVVDIETNKIWMCLQILFRMDDLYGFWDQLGSQITTFDKVWLSLAILFSTIFGSRVRSHKRKFYLFKKQFSNWYNTTIRKRTDSATEH